MSAALIHYAGQALIALAGAGAVVVIVGQFRASGAKAWAALQNAEARRAE